MSFYSAPCHWEETLAGCGLTNKSLKWPSAPFCFISVSASLVGAGSFALYFLDDVTLIFGELVNED